MLIELKLIRPERSGTRRIKISLSYEPENSGFSYCRVNTFFSLEKLKDTNTLSHVCETSTHSSNFSTLCFMFDVFCHLPPFVRDSLHTLRPFFLLSPLSLLLRPFPRLNLQQVSELRSQVEELQRALQEQDSRTEDVSAGGAASFSSAHFVTSHLYLPSA